MTIREKAGNGTLTKRYFFGSYGTNMWLDCWTCSVTIFEWRVGQGFNASIFDSAMRRHELEYHADGHEATGTIK